METTIRKWGNSPALRLPAALLREAALSIDQPVNITISSGRLVIEPTNQVTYSLDDLLDGIRPDNRHAEVSTGAPVGKETW